MAETKTTSDDGKTKVIETEKLLIRGHLLRYADAAIQIGNISLVSIEHLPLPRFPNWTLIVTLIGSLIVCYSCYYGGMYSSYGGPYYDEDTMRIGSSLIAVGVISIFIWIGIRATRMEKKYLNIRMNSGDVYCLFLSDQSFMRMVLQLLANIIETGTTPQTYFSIEVHDCHIRDSNGNLVNVVER